ncbi:MAG: hypothetical protein E7017_06825 [Alphaproteobacteria bacterium]|nr:hypothetical protein [Alphaproteobacteria bacterium]
MKHAENYEIVLSDEGIPVIVIPYNRLRAENPILLYDGGKHATLFRNDHDVVLLDYLPDGVRPILLKCGWAVVLEKNKAEDNISKDYKVLIKVVKNNPLTDGI